MADMTGDESANAERRRKHANDELTPICAAGAFTSMRQKECNNPNHAKHHEKQHHAEQEITPSSHFA